MGAAANVSGSSYPKQGQFLGRRMRVCFNYDTSKLFGGLCIRDDSEEPCRVIIQLDDGRVLLASECQYQPVENPTSAELIASGRSLTANLPENYNECTTVVRLLAQRLEEARESMKQAEGHLTLFRPEVKEAGFILRRELDK